MNITKQRTILALDTATKCGWAIWRENRIIASGMENFQSKSVGRKLSKFHKWLNSMIQRYSITEIVAEDIFFDEHKKSAFWSLGEMRGIIYLTIEELDLTLSFIEPQRHKFYLCGTQYATKTDTQNALQRLGYGFIECNDEADAIAILLTHIKARTRPYKPRKR